MRRRGSGVLLHVTSLPGRYGVGDLGPGAERFIDFLAEAGQSVWQILPLGPTSPGIKNSPYSSFSAFAGNRILISPDKLVAEHWLTPEDIAPPREYDTSRSDFEAADVDNNEILRKTFVLHGVRMESDQKYLDFCRDNAHWLDDYALFMALKEQHGGAAWGTWDMPLRRREAGALRQAAADHAEEIKFVKFCQFLFHRQWTALKEYANGKGVFILGDAPIYVTYDSSDVWANQRYFKLDQEGTPIFVAGVPPDYFSETGQLWGNPVFDWEALKQDGYGWWLERMAQNLKLYDLVRIDHFRGFAGFWQVPMGEKTAENGEWIDGPGVDFFEVLAARFPCLPIVAEDLGVITSDVRELRDAFGLPGMRILQFGFGDRGGEASYAPHNHIENCLVYTGTHDNNTTRGWYRQEASSEVKNLLNMYVGHEVTEESVAWDLVRLAMASVSKLSVYPMQDLLGLDESARMNLPGVADGNWSWRITEDAASPELAARLKEFTRLFGRCQS